MRAKRWLYTIPLRLRSLFRRKNVETELTEELQYHLEQKIREYSANGLTGDEARRKALQSDVLWMVMEQVVVLSGAGLAVGALLAFALSSLIRSQLYGLQPHDPFTYVSAAVVLAAAACAAGFIPSWRASRVDPMRALRYE